MLVATLIFGWLIILVAPDTAIGRGLHHWTVTCPATWLNRITRGHVALALVVLGLILGALWLEGDAIRLLSLALPDAVSWAVMIDLSALLDGAITAFLIASSVRWSAVRAHLFGRVTRAKPRHPRRRRDARPVRKAPANDDDGPARVLAA